MKNVKVSFGNLITSPVLVPVEHKSTPTCINDPFMVDGECYKVTAVSLGSPHGVVFVDDVDTVDVERIGKALGTHVLFPEGASIVFVQMREDKKSLKARLWQRGEGEVMFTPEGACVAGSVAIMLQKTFHNEISVTMGNTTLLAEWDRLSGDVSISGDPSLLLKDTTDLKRVFSQGSSAA